MTSLCWASLRVETAIGRLPIDGETNTNARSDNGRSPLSYVLRHGHKALIDFLLENGAEINDEDRETMGLGMEDDSRGCHMASPRSAAEATTPIGSPKFQTFRCIRGGRKGHAKTVVKPPCWLHYPVVDPADIDGRPLMMIPSSNPVELSGDD